MLRAQQRFDILDSATGSQDFRLMNQLHRMTPIISVREKFPERLGTMVGVDNERAHTGRDQVIEHKGDERLLENRNERLGQIFSERTQSHPEPRAENESLRD